MVALRRLPLLNHPLPKLNEKRRDMGEKCENLMFGSITFTWLRQIAGFALEALFQIEKISVDKLNDLLNMQKF